MECTEIYAGPEGHSLFRTIRVFETGPVMFNGIAVSLSPPEPCENVLVHEFDGSYCLAWHNPPSRQYVIVLEGELEISVQGTNAVQRFAAGAMFVAGDLQGTGHTTRALRAGRALVVNLQE